MATIGTLQAFIGLNTMGLRADTMRAQGMFKRFEMGANRSLGGIMASVGKLGVAMAGLAGAIGAVKVFQDLQDIGGQFEQTMTTVAAVMRATDEQFQALTESARTMGETTEWTASQAGEALKFLGMAGFEVDKAISALPGTLDLATAGNLDLGRAADIATNALTAMGLPVEELTRVNDVFIGTITRSNVNMENMAEAFKYAAPVAKAFGYSIEETSAMIGKLGDAGVQGSMAGTQLAMAIQQANKVAREFGYESSDLVDVLEKMAEEGRTNADVMDLFGLRAGRAALILKDAIAPTKAFQETLGGVAGESARLAEKMRSTFVGAKKELTSVMESIKIDVFDKFKASLKGSVRDVTAWLRENKEQILAFVDDLIKGFSLLWGSVKMIWTIVSEVVGGVIDVFDELEKQSQETTDALIKNAEDIRAAFKPPDFTPWERMLHQTAQWGRIIVQLVGFVVKGVAQLIAGLAKTIVSDLIVNVLEALWEFAGAVERLTFGDLEGAWDKIVSAGSQVKQVWTDADQTAGAVMRSWETAFNDLVAGFDFRSIEDVWVDVQFGKALTGAAEDAMEEVGEAAVHTAKGVSLLTQGMEEVANMADKLRDTNVAVYREILEQTDLTRSEMLRMWRGYKTARIEQIRAEIEALRQMGVPLEALDQLLGKRMEELSAEQKDLFAEQATWLHEWAMEVAADLRGAFSEFFYSAMKDDFTSLTDYLEGVWDAFLRRIADRAAGELMGLFDAGKQDAGSAGLVGRGLKLLGLQHGGLVTSPTLAMVGEVPEVVIPLDKLRDSNFLDGMGATSGDVNVSFNVQTPDTASFRASQQQLMAQAAVALSGARRNL